MNKKKLGAIGTAGAAIIAGAIWLAQDKQTPQPVITPVPHTQAFAGDVLRLPDGSTYTVPPSTQIIFQTPDIEPAFCLGATTWKEVVKAKPYVGCRMKFGNVNWYFVTCMTRRPWRDTPGERPMQATRPEGAPVEDSPDCANARARQF